MKSILEALRTGSSTERLAIVADITSIVGVSLASVIGGLFAVSSKTGAVNIEHLMFSVLATLATLAVAFAVVAGFILFLSKLSVPWGTPKGVQSLIVGAAWLIFLCVFLFASYAYFLFISAIKVVQ